MPLTQYKQQQPKTCKIHRKNKDVHNYVGLLGAAMEGLVVGKDVRNTVLGLARAREWAKLVDYADSLASQQYGDMSDHFRMNQLAALIRKVPFKHKDLAPEAVALQKFRSAEHKCKRVNLKFRLRGESNPSRNPYHSLYDSMRAWIRKVIGDKPPLEKIYAGCDFGPGSSIGVTGTKTHALAKLASDKWTATPSCLPYVLGAFWAQAQIREAVLTDHPPSLDTDCGLDSADPVFYCLDPQVFRDRVSEKLLYVDHNKIDFVSKTAKTHRSIAIEPVLNGFLQKGVDTFLRRQLVRVGIDLSNQEMNQLLAQEGSRPDLADPFVTIDLKAASDTIALVLVKLLLPREWFNFLDAIRSPSFIFEEGGTATRFEKFASMGNGFCFPLETLIFAAAVHSVYEVTKTRDSTYRVYGDDIIVRQSSALFLIELLKDMGFTTNKDKTFLFGPFRESCGADYFDGVNVRPYTLDFIPSNDVDYIKIANGIYDNLFYHNKTLWQYVINKVPRADRYFRPVHGSPDAAITVPLDVFMASKSKRWFPLYQAWGWREILQIPIEDTCHYNKWQMYGVLRGQPSQDGELLTTVRRETRTVRRWCMPDAVTHPERGASSLSQAATK